MQTITYAPSHDTDSVTSRPCGLAALAAEGWSPLTPGGPQVGGSPREGSFPSKTATQAQPGGRPDLGRERPFPAHHALPAAVPSTVPDRT